MKSILKRVMLVMGVTALAFTIGACGSKKGNDTQQPATGEQPVASGEKSASEPAKGEDVTLRFSWWGGDDRHAVTQDATKLYSQKNPNVKIDTEYGAWIGWEEKMALQFSQGKAPDLNQINWNWIESYSASGDAFYDLNQVSDILDLIQFDPAALELCTVDGKLQAVPVSMTGRLYYWNKTTWEKAGLSTPKTWDDLINAGEVFRTTLGEEYYPFMLTEYDRMIFMVYWLECKYGKNWVENNELQYTPEEIEEGFAMIKELEDKHVIPTMKEINELSADPVDQSDRWIDGYYAGVHTWNTSSYTLKMALEQSTNVIGQEFVVGDFLTGIGDYKGGFTKISMCFAIAANTEHPEEAAKLMQFLLADEEGVTVMSDARGVPVNAKGMQIAADKGFVEPIILEASEAVLGYNSFALDSKFEHASLKAAPEGVYQVVFENHSYDNYDNAKATSELIKGINEVLGN